MKKQRYQYCILILGIIIAGLLSRKTAVLPAATGDALYAAMMYFIVRCCFLKWKIRTVALVATGICFAVEFSQCYQAPWINGLRSTLPGRLVLGQGFLWSDLLAYVTGTAAAALADALKKGSR